MTTQTNKIKEEIEIELDRLVKLGLLNKSKAGYIDSMYSRRIDKMKPREAFLEGLTKGKKQATADFIKMIEKIFDNSLICKCGHKKNIHNLNMVENIDGTTKICYHNWEQSGCDCKKFRLDKNVDINIIKEELKQMLVKTK